MFYLKKKAVFSRRGVLINFWKVLLCPHCLVGKGESLWEHQALIKMAKFPFCSIGICRSDGFGCESVVA